MIIMIAAVAENNTLGKNNELVWHLPNDFKRFKSLTTNHHIIMGRKTFESFPKPLPNRTHIIITRQTDYNPEGCIVVDSMEKAIAACPENEDSYIIGGGEIYNLGLPYADIIEITKVHHTFEGDAFFPKISKSEWQLVESEENFKDEKHLYDYTYETYIRK
ncbi:dihydrofolate reductase [Flavobacterium johnsoniae]|uniref:Dihydrofolate reductase n=2 Tax=Flavobacterium johnsoniae TaxID=986 RepID=A0A1M6QVM8_FLAJO|nr:dihydrofolate reductase [Flavobacterium johnsoniae]ABQ04500.1 dihydrofolate reductase [Flavobacterium johnsoniae UW101]OXE97825.1 diacylglycerol kinase [Flavobacterium johnsoniae UW101]WQG83704.1 dihydrofolate reductase [Flavobacterium johnsoniae UW101]SHG04768.1 dihydrofolate reductase [Flavobacterium johnsoniae]SHK24117.1 dihydrofolate reductase [Flavobacterium johnsoniae]